LIAQASPGSRLSSPSVWASIFWRTGWHSVSIVSCKGRRSPSSCKTKSTRPRLTRVRFVVYIVRSSPISSNHDTLGLRSRKSQVWLRLWCHLSAQVSRRHPLRLLSQILGSYRSCSYSLPSCKLPRRNRPLAALRLRLILYRDHPQSATLILPPLRP
jgi:hypothetical protein